MSYTLVKVEKFVLITSFVHQYQTWFQIFGLIPWYNAITQKFSPLSVYMLISIGQTEALYIMPMSIFPFSFDFDSHLVFSWEIIDVCNIIIMWTSYDAQYCVVHIWYNRIHACFIYPCFNKLKTLTWAWDIQLWE